MVGTDGCRWKFSMALITGPGMPDRRANSRCEIPASTLDRWRNRPAWVALISSPTDGTTDGTELPITPYYRIR